MSESEHRLERLRMVRDSVAAVAPPGGDLRRIRGLRYTRPGFDRRVWGTMCELGWPGLRVPEAEGGSGLGMAEYCVVAEELGAGLTPEPLIAAALAARLLAGPDLATLLSGERLILPAWSERAGALGPDGETGWRDGRLYGRKRYVPFAAGADAFLIVLPGAVALLPVDAPGLTLATEPTQDGGHYGTLMLEGVAAARVEMASERVLAALDEATLATAAMLLGLAERAFAITLEYLRTRRQFGRPIGAFQALQHRAADARVQLALTRASIGSAAAILDAGAAGAARSAAVSRAKARASTAAMAVTREAIQMHGAIGYTDEADPGLFLRRAMVLASQHGTAAAHRARFAMLSPEDA
jgi:alkylation response protein AidB-like acyl-CoA dehydrogenase